MSAQRTIDKRSTARQESLCRDGDMVFSNPCRLVGCGLHRTSHSGSVRRTRRCRRVREVPSVPGRRALERRPGRPTMAPTEPHGHPPPCHERGTRPMTAMAEPRADAVESAELLVGDKTLKLPVVPATEGSPAVDVAALLKDTGYTALDYGFANTAATKSAITFLDGENGHPALPRLPDRAARRAVDLPRDRLPAHLRRAPDGRAARGVARPRSRATRCSTRR